MQMFRHCDNKLSPRIKNEKQIERCSAVSTEIALEVNHRVTRRNVTLEKSAMTEK